MGTVRQDEHPDDSSNDHLGGAAGRPEAVSTASGPTAVIAAALKRERARVGLSIGELARRAGIGKSTLSQLEQGLGNPSIETVWALSEALGLTFSDLVDTPPRRVEVIRFGDGPAIPSATAEYISTLLSAASPSSRRDIFLLRAEPGEPKVSRPHARGVVEHVVLCAGKALVGPLDDPVELLPGDFISYPGDADHVFDALESGTFAVLVSEAF
ncbi:helix-turn-helix domain-containing protein [Gordonia jacobaea]|uniref:helix-turn-helix domain-containing protein n=1 Tax=Gordonia jacobaea TaxID=122202 RepID=UPI003D71437A